MAGQFGAGQEASWGAPGRPDMIELAVWDGFSAGDIPVDSVSYGRTMEGNLKSFKTYLETTQIPPQVRKEVENHSHEFSKVTRPLLRYCPVNHAPIPFGRPAQQGQSCICGGTAVARKGMLQALTHATSTALAVSWPRTSGHITRVSVFAKAE